MNNIFVLAYSSWEEYVPYLFSGPSDLSEEAFEEICRNLLPEAALAAISLASDEYGLHWVGWNDIVEQVIPLLEKRGFVHFKPKRASFSGPGIIDDANEAEGLGTSSQAVLDHNQKVRDQTEEEMRKENLPEYQSK